MDLPDGIKHAIEMGANEAIYEWTCNPTEDELKRLGASYQSIGDDAADDDEAAEYITDLAAWDDHTFKGSPGAKFEHLVYQAGIEFARGLIAAAAGLGTVPDRVKPYMPQLAPLVEALKEMLDGEEVDEEWVSETIWGEGDDDDEGDDEGDDDEDGSGSDEA